MKTAPQTPLSALKVAALAKEVGFPMGAINIVPGLDETGVLVAQHPDLDKIAFTGSTSVGRKIMHQAADAFKLSRVTLELGGKSPIIAFDDCDIDTLVAHSHTGLFLNQGQCCCASSRIFVQEVGLVLVLGVPSFRSRMVLCHTSSVHVSWRASERSV
jgi:aldehyde dehydrogenase (NAD+)